MAKSKSNGTPAKKNKSSKGSTTAKSNASKSNVSKAATNKTKTLEDLFEEGLKEIYNAEQQLIKALPEMAKAVCSEDLEEAFTSHLEQTERQVERLEKVFERLEIDPEEKQCEAMEGLIEEGNRIIAEIEEGSVRDSALIISEQKIEHYEIAAYGSLCELADVLGYTKIADILGRTLEEEKETDEELTSIAMDVNDEAYELSQQEEEVEGVY